MRLACVIVLLLAACGPSAERRAICEGEAKIAADSIAYLRGYQRAAELVDANGSIDTIVQREMLTEADSMRARTLRLCLERMR